MLLASALRGIVLLLGSLSLTIAASDNTQLPQSVTLSYEILGDSHVKPLVTVLYDPKSRKHSLSAWTPPSLDPVKSTSPEPTSSRLVRIHLPNGSSTVTTLAAFSEEVHQKIDLWLSPEDGSVFSASVSSVSPPSISAEEDRYRKKVARAKAKGKAIPSRPPVPNTKKAREEAARLLALYEPIKVNLFTAEDGPSPILNTRAAPQVDAEGREVVQEEQQEKSFLQKYWWIFLAVAVLTMGIGGDK